MLRTLLVASACSGLWIGMYAQVPLWVVVALEGLAAALWCLALWKSETH